MASVTPARRNDVLPPLAVTLDVTSTWKEAVDIEMRWSKARDMASMDSRAARAEANQLFVRETLARREPAFARTVERAAEAIVRDMMRRRCAARGALAVAVA